MMRECAYPPCTQTFAAARNRRFCSSLCRERSRPSAKTRKRHWYWGNREYVRAYMKEWNEERREPLMLIKCGNPECDIMWARRRKPYCNKRCSRRAYDIRHFKPWVEIKCENCATPILTNKWNRRWCSKLCRHRVKAWLEESTPEGRERRRVKTARSAKQQAVRSRNRRFGPNGDEVRDKELARRRAIRHDALMWRELMAKVERPARRTNTRLKGLSAEEIREKQLARDRDRRAALLNDALLYRQWRVKVEHWAKENNHDVDTISNTAGQRTPPPEAAAPSADFVGSLQAGSSARQS
jgi:hypothetical protein